MATERALSTKDREKLEQLVGARIKAVELKVRGTVEAKIQAIKEKAIEAGKAKQEKLRTKVLELGAKRSALDQEIRNLEQEIHDLRDGSTPESKVAINRIQLASKQMSQQLNVVETSATEEIWTDGMANNLRAILDKVPSVDSLDGAALYKALADISPEAAKLLS
jgi:hypothetical protein